jgi:Flp pilus assembly protein protease CpaA
MELLLSKIVDCTTIFQWGVFIGSSMVAAVDYVRYRRIPNALTFPLLVAGLIWSALFSGISGLGEAFGACMLLGVPYVLLFLFAGGGAGDAKLMGAIGTWLGLKQSVIVLLCVVSAGLVLALAKAAKERRLKLVLTNVVMTFYAFLLCIAGGRRPSVADARSETDVEPADRLEVPYGVAIAAGVCAAAAVVTLWGKEWLW